MAGGDRRSRAEGEAPRVAPTRLPRTGPVFVGRDAELRWLDACWDEGVHVASLVAWGGGGKTTLVGRWRNRLRDAGWRGAARVFDWSFYSQGTSEKRVTSADAFVSAALGWFGDADPTAGSPWDRGERLAELVRGQRTLLILDGIEPLQGGPGLGSEEGVIRDPALQALVRGLAGDNKGLCVITTRIEVADLASLAGEKVFEKTLKHLSAEAGADLLRKWKVKGSDEELREAAEEVKGHCLALTLLGSYLEEACEGDIRRRKEIGPLEEDERLGGHARRVMAAYERWFQGGPEIAILRMLGLFDRPADEGEIAALREPPVIVGLTDALIGLGEHKWNKAVAKLRRAGLLAADAQEKRLDAHPLVREHFGEQVRQAYPEAWREGHQRLYEHLKKAAKPLPDTIEEMTPLYAAVVHGCKAGKHEEALEEIYWRRIQRESESFNSKKLGAFGSEAALLSAFFDLPWERLAPGLNESNQAFVLGAAGFTLQALGRLSEAAELLRLGLERAIALEHWQNAAIAAANLSQLLEARGELTEAVAVAWQSVELAGKSGNASQLMLNTASLAATLHAMGRWADAVAQFEEAERIQKEWQPAYPRLYSLQGFRYCDLLLDQDRGAEVRERAAQTPAWVKADGDLLSIAVDHLSLGRAHLLAAQRGTAADHAPATAHLQQAVEGLRSAGAQEFFPRGLLARAALHTFTRAFAAAHRDLAEALSLATRCGFRLHEADAHLGYARLHLAEGDRAAAREHLGQARAIIDQTGYHRRDEELARLETMTRDQLHDALCHLLPAQLDTLGFKLAIPPAYLPGPQAPAASRVTELLRWAEQQGGLAQVEQRYLEVTGRAAPVHPPSAMTAGPAPAPPATPVALSAAPSVSFPPPLLDAYRQNKLAVLFGGGLSLAKDVQGDFPRWSDLPERLIDQAAKLGVWSSAQLDAKRAFFRGGHLPLEGMLSELDTLKTALRSVRKYQAALNAIFRPANAAPGDVHRALVALGVNVLATTNYDALLEAAEGPPVRMAYPWMDADKALLDIEEGRKVLFKIHGTADREETVVMTVAEYARAAAHAPYQRALSLLLQSQTFLLVGYGINDPLDLDLVFALNASAFGSASRTHYALMKDASASDRDRWQRSFNVQVVPYQDHGELPAILRALRAAKP